jgi:glycosyltransferase involved in cell wall biosynthesis
MSIRVLIIDASLDILGGQAIQAARLVRHLEEEPSVEVSFVPINPRLPGKLRKLQSIKYVRTVTTSILYGWTLLREVRKFDIIHIFSAAYLSFLIAPAPAILAGKLYGKKVVLNYHSGEAEDHLRRWPRSTTRFLKLADALVVPSEYLVRVFAKFGFKASAIYNDIELDEFVFRERGPLRPVFLSNRNLEKHYGVDCLLRAFALIQQQVPEAVLTVVGNGKQRQVLEKLKDELGLRHTSFTGRVEHEDIYRYYAEADVFLNASRVDNQPLSILEAFACGLPVVTTDAGGIPDIVTHGETALTVRVDDCEGLAKAAMKLLTDCNTATTMIQKARKESMKYRWEVLRDQWLRLYREVVEKNS